MEALRNYWRSQLGEFPPPVDLPAHFPRPPVRSGRGSHAHLRLSLPLHASLMELARKRQASLFMLLVALVKVLIYRYSGETDIAVGIPVAGRTHPDLDGQIGLFANTIVLRSRLDDAQSFAVVPGDRSGVRAAAPMNIRTILSTNWYSICIRRATPAAIHYST